MVGTGVNENRAATADAKYMANQMVCHETRIDDNTRDLHELMGTVDIIKEEVQKLTNMTQCSHCQETPAVDDYQMEEPSVAQSVRGIEEHKK